MKLVVIEGDLLEQRVDVIVNPWSATSFLGGFCCRRGFQAQSSGAQATRRSSSLAGWGRSHWARPS